ncbi:MAG: cytochrome P450 [Parasphingorhabdus sp.]|jgi:cytochrome P450
MSDRTNWQNAAESFDPRALPADFFEDPYPTYRALQAFDPLHICPDGSLFLTRYRDLQQVYRDARVFSSDKTLEFGEKYGASPLLEHHTTSLVFNDPPLHTRVRKILVGALSARAITAMESDLVRLVDDLLSQMDEKSSYELVADFASAIPVEVIGNLLDIPQEDRGRLRDWSLAILGALEPVLSEEQELNGNNAVVEFTDYLDQLIVHRRKCPGNPEKDVLTRLISGDKNTQPLSTFELVHNCIFILNAGHETTTNLIANSLHALLSWPLQKQQLLSQPALITTAVDEFLRFESSNQLGNRIAVEEFQLHEKKFAAGTRITLCIGAANRDPAVFPDADDLCLDRAPNKHLAFAAGPHLCAGISLARLEGKIAISRFLQKYPNYHADGVTERNKRIRFRGMRRLPVKLR